MGQFERPNRWTYAKKRTNKKYSLMEALVSAGIFGIAAGAY